MSQQSINLGSGPNTGDGDQLRVGGAKINANFTELYLAVNNANLLAFSGLIGAADRFPYFTGVGALSLATISAYSRQLLALADLAAWKGAGGLNLGSAANVNLGVANGAASLGADGKLPPAQLPPLAVNETFVVASQVAMLALVAERGDMAFRTDEGNTPYVLTTDDPSVLANWKTIASPLSAALAALNVLTPAADKVPYFTGASTSSMLDAGATGKDVLAATSQALGRTALGLGTAATINTGVVGASLVQAATADAAQTAIGATTIGKALILAASAAAGRTALALGTASTVNTGATGASIMAAANTDAAQTAMGATTVGKALMVATDQAAGRTALGLKTAAVADVLGTVSQSGGEPTGAIMEYGTNSNGVYWKFASGLMICQAAATFTTAVATALNGGFYSASPVPVKNMPATFAAIPTVYKEVTTSTTPNDSTGYGGISGPATVSTWNGFYLGDLFSRGSQTYIIHYTAIGRWF